jgi:hypothetical protein
MCSSLLQWTPERSGREAALLAAAICGVMAAALPTQGRQCTPVQLLHPTGLAQDRFGQSVAISGDTAIVGAPQDDVSFNAQGSAHIYRWTKTGWILEATLAASDGAANDVFGYSVAIDGDTAVVGARFADVSGRSEQGAAYVFVRSGNSTWTQQAKLVAGDGLAVDLFGSSVSIFGDTVLVGAPGDDSGTVAEVGSAYAFTRSGSTWMEHSRLAAVDGSPGDALGVAVALGQDIAIVGAAGDDVSGHPDQGSAVVFRRMGSVWVQEARLVDPAGAAGDAFGSAVAISDQTVIVGAHGDDIGLNSDQGSASVFAYIAGAWLREATVTDAAGSAGDRFGWSVTIDGDTALVGAILDHVGPSADQGSARVFTRSGGVWTAQSDMIAPDGEAGDNFGIAVAVAGDKAIVGAYADDVGADAAEGSAWVFTRVSGRWIGPDTRLMAVDRASGDWFGMQVVIDGDTALVGAPYDDVGANGAQGSVYVYTRSGSTAWQLQDRLNAPDGAAADHFGQSIALSDDTALIGAPDAQVGGHAHRGAAYVFYRLGTAWILQTKLIATDGAVWDHFGDGAALQGDTAIVSASLDDVHGSTDQGSAYVFTRSGAAWTQQARLIASDGGPSDYFGLNSVDLDADTAIIGAREHDVDGNVAQGAAYIFTRTGTQWTQQARLVAAAGLANDWFGFDVAIDGDTAVIGAWLADVVAGTDQGAAFVFVRSGSAWRERARLVAPNPAPGDNFGFSVDISRPTVVVTANDESAGRGAAYVFTGSAGTWTFGTRLTAPDAAPGDGFGQSVALQGSTVIVGAHLHDDEAGGTVDQGAAYIFDIGTCRPPCRPDFNGSGTISVQDIFDFLAAYFAGCTVPGAPPCYASADFNGSGAISVQDIFDFLAAYFAGCP